MYYVRVYPELGIIDARFDNNYWYVRLFGKEIKLTPIEFRENFSIIDNLKEDDYATDWSDGVEENSD